MELKDIAIASLGAASAIASVLLVYVGFMIMKAEGLPSTTNDTVIARYKKVAKGGLVPFLAQAIVIFACYVWMFFPWRCLFFLWSIGFVVALVLFIVYSVIVTRML